jgi:exodeoxyribonuclease V alpha subunit
MVGNLEIVAKFTSERLRFPNADGDVIIGSAWANSDINGEISLKGPAELDELIPGLEYVFYGKWAAYKNKRTGQTEQQFAFTSFVKKAPHNREGIIAYLVAAGEGLGFGRARAAKCWDLFGTEAVTRLRESPQAVVESLTSAGLRVSTEVGEKLAANLREEQALESCTLDLMDVLTGRGFPKATARAAVRQWGNRAAQVIRRNPYQLMNFRGCGFRKTDALYLDLGRDPSAIRRQGLCAWYSLSRDSEGHTWFPLEVVERGIRESVSGTQINLEKSLRFAKKLGAVAELRTSGNGGPIVQDGGSCRWLAEGTKAKNEGDLSQCVADALREPATLWPNVADVQGIDDHQRAALAAATTRAIGILGGGPGTGKTYTVACLVKLLAATIGIDNIRIGAPTGKAAVRVTENLSKHGLTIRARTWHSLLGMTGGDKFPAKVLIGDETSMNDTDLMAAIFRARSAGCHVLLVGDVHQLPPVGHGAPLRDLIATGLPYGELTEIKRNSGGIVETCAAIRHGQRWQPGDNLLLFEHREPEFQIKRMLQLLRQCRDDGRDPIWDCQVVVPVNKKSPLARQTLNKILQAELNSNPAIEGSPFRIDDKIVNTANGYFPTVELGADVEADAKNDQGEVYVANGELAKVLDVQPGCLIASLSNPSRTIRIPRGKANSENSNEQPDDGDGGNSDKSTGTGCSWDLGYALSVHKSQGSEWPVVLVMLDDYAGAKMVCSREWLYTALSRAKEVCVMIGQRQTADSMCRRIALDKRKTLLKERILLVSAQDSLADL